MSERFITYRYIFKFKEGSEKEFVVHLNPNTLDLVTAKKESHPEWSELKFHKCPNCPLDETKERFCPVAVNITELIEFFKDSISYEEVDVTVVSELRDYSKRVKLQEAISSLLGIYMVTSGCPIMDKLRPMVYVHLPFAKSSETVFRVFGMYLMAQYFLHQDGRPADWELKNLQEIYKNVREVNKSFSNRISNAISKDAGVNAIVILDCFALAATITIDGDSIKSLKNLFKVYY